MAEFFDKLKQGVSKGVNTVNVKSKEMLEVSRLKSQLAELQKKKGQLLEELGSIAHTMLSKGALDEERLNAKSSEIGKLEEELSQKEDELAETHTRAQEALGKPKAVGTCSCGAEIHEGTKFCGKCGKKVEAAG